MSQLSRLVAVLLIAWREVSFLVMADTWFFLREFMSQPGTYWVLTVTLVAAGIAGTFLPVIPGHFFIVLAGVSHWYFAGDASGLEWWALVVLVLLWGLAAVLEFLSGAVGSKFFGGSRWGGVGAVSGGLVGLFFMPIGLLVGPLVGAFLLEWLVAKKDIGEATKSGVGSVVGALTGAVAKFSIVVVMIVYLFAHIFWIGK